MDVLNTSLKLYARTVAMRQEDEHFYVGFHFSNWPVENRVVYYS